MTAESLARFCGPVAVASALGITPEAAARRILANRPAYRRSRRSTIRFYRGSTRIDELATVVGGTVVRVGFYPLAQRAPTLAQWLRANPDTDAILRVGRHFVHARGGKVVGDTLSRPPLRRRVTHAIYLTSVCHGC